MFCTMNIVLLHYIDKCKWECFISYHLNLFWTWLGKTLKGVILQVNGLKHMINKYFPTPYSRASGFS